MTACEEFKIKPKDITQPKNLFRMKYLSTLLFGAVILFFSCQTQSKKSEAKSKGEISKPNIIYILADDLGYGDLSFQGQTKFQTPNIDQLAKDGMTFTQHYAGSTVCSPSSLSSTYRTAHRAYTNSRKTNAMIKEIGPFLQKHLLSQKF